MILAMCRMVRTSYISGLRYIGNTDPSRARFSCRDRGVHLAVEEDPVAPQCRVQRAIPASFRDPGGIIAVASLLMYS